MFLTSNCTEGDRGSTVSPLRCLTWYLLVKRHQCHQPTLHKPRVNAGQHVFNIFYSFQLISIWKYLWTGFRLDVPSNHDEWHLCCHLLFNLILIFQYRVSELWSALHLTAGLFFPSSHLRSTAILIQSLHFGMALTGRSIGLVHCGASAWQ